MKVAESMKGKWRSMMKYPCIALSVTYSTPFFGNMRTKPVKPNLLQAWCQGVARDSQELRATRGGKLGCPVTSQCWVSDLGGFGSRWLCGLGSTTQSASFPKSIRNRTSRSCSEQPKSISDQPACISLSSKHRMIQAALSRTCRLLHSFSFPENKLRHLL